MKIVETIKQGLNYGAFSAATMAVPVAIMGVAYGCYKMVSKISDKRKKKKVRNVVECVDFKEVE